jgi:hypothetical protein
MFRAMKGPEDEARRRVSAPGGAGEFAGLRLDALTEPIVDDAVRRAAGRLETQRGGRRDFTDQRFIWASGLAVFLGLSGVGLAVLGIVVLSDETLPNPLGSALGPFIFGFVLLGIAALLVSTVPTWLRRRMTPEGFERFTRVAADNGLAFDPGPRLPDASSPLSRYNYGGRQRLTLRRVVTASGPRRAEAANWEYVSGGSTVLIGDGATTTTAAYRGGCLALRLERQLPSVVFRARGVGKPFISAAGAAWLLGKRRMRINDAIDRLYVIQSDPGVHDELRPVLERCESALAELSDLHLEVNGAWLICASKRDMVTLEPGDWHRLEELVRAATQLADALDPIAGRSN